MTRLNKKELRIQLLDEVQADCEDLFSKTELDLGSELEKLVDVIVLANKKVELGDLSEGEAIVLLDDQIEQTVLKLTKKSGCLQLNMLKLKESIHAIAQINQ